ncbi:hypothetical protein GGS20DRAFT_568642 [Poronia punctata]|nr:hypothetical protein GGS20DRAFT_568642 [Poronia punctata]
MDLNGAPSATRDPVDLTGRRAVPDDRDIDGKRRSRCLDAPDLTGPRPEKEKEIGSVDINGRYPSVHDAPDLVESGKRRLRG